MSLNLKKRLQKNLKVKAFRDAFISSRIDQTVAFQLKALRQREELSQKALADRLGTSQNAVCRMESPGYGKHSVTSLKRVAAFFDVGLIIRFAPITEIADWSLDPSPFKVEVPRFQDEITGEWFSSPVAETIKRAQVGDPKDTGSLLDTIVNKSSKRLPFSAIESLGVWNQADSNRLENTEEERASAASTLKLPPHNQQEFRRDDRLGLER